MKPLSKECLSLIDRGLLLLVCFAGLAMEYEVIVANHDGNLKHGAFVLLLLAGISYSIKPPRFPWSK